MREIFESEVLKRFTEQDTMDVPRILVKQLLKEVSKAEAVALIEEMSKDSGNWVSSFSFFLIASKERNEIKKRVQHLDMSLCIDMAYQYEYSVLLLSNCLIMEI